MLCEDTYSLCMNKSCFIKSIDTVNIIQFRHLSDALNPERLTFKQEQKDTYNVQYFLAIDNHKSSLN